LGKPIDDRPTRVTKPEEFCDLVERLARGVVTGRTKLSHMVHGWTVDAVNRRVPARRKERDKRERRHLARALRPPQKYSEQVTDEVIHTDKREPTRPRETLGGLHPDKQCTHETRTVCDRDPREIIPAHVRSGERLAHNRTRVAEVISRRKLWNDATIRRVDRDLRMHDVGVDEPFAVHHGRCRLVTRRLNA
jgi:hypothetical protein